MANKYEVVETVQNYKKKKYSVAWNISRLQQIDISDSDRDDIVDAVKDELDKQFK